MSDNRLNLLCKPLLSGDFIFKQLRTCTTSLIPTFNFSTGIRRHTFKLPASGPREEGTVVNKSTASDIKLQFLQHTSTVMHRPSRFTTFTLGLARWHSCGKNAAIIFDNLFRLIIIFSSDSSDISKSLSLSFSFSSSIFTGRSFVGSTFTSHLLVDCAERASTNSFEVGLCRTDTEALLELSV
jgi:hypothetical protein